MVLFGAHAWFYSGGMSGFIWGGVCGFIWGACMVAPGGHAWLLPRGVWLLWGGGVRGFFDEIPPMSGRYASYWNAFLFSMFVVTIESYRILWNLLNCTKYYCCELV